jgi:hypothetical protein
VAHKIWNLKSITLIIGPLCAALVFVLFSGSISNATITANGTVTSTQTVSATSLTWSHTLLAGTNRCLFVQLSIDGLGAPVTGVTYGGVALTQVGRGAGNHAIEIWRLINPAVGTTNVVANFGGTTAAAGGATTTSLNRSRNWNSFPMLLCGMLKKSGLYSKIDYFWIT